MYCVITSLINNSQFRATLLGVSVSSLSWPGETLKAKCVSPVKENLKQQISTEVFEEIVNTLWGEN